MAKNAGSLTIKGDKALSKKLLDIAKKTPAAAESALFIEANRIMGISKEKYVPVDWGTLRSAGIVGKNKHVEKPKTTFTGSSVRMGYGSAAADYAIIVHENPRAGKTGGVSPSGKKYKRWSTVGGWKFLERPVMENAGSFRVNMFILMKAFLKRQGK